MPTPIPRKTLVNIAAIAALLAAIFIARHYLHSYTIPQNGMYPSHPAHSRVVVLRQAYESIVDIHRGDVIVYSTQRDGATYDMVWRVIALPGETIAVAGDAVSIDGRALPHRPVRTEGDVHIEEETNGGVTYLVAYSTRADPEHGPTVQLTVPNGHVFAMGDNRDNAYDCRFTGPVAFHQVEGKVWH